jgi:X-X-X-Leu-X-X-Gly heptad repeat protein
VSPKSPRSPTSPTSGDSEDPPGEPAPGESGTFATGKRAATATDESGRSKRISDAAKDALGSGIGTLGDGVSKLGEGVSKLGDLSRHVPVVGSSVSKIGEGISHVGETLHGLPQVARTRRGRLLIRSAIVGFFLVAAWIVVIVGLQLHGNDTPDFRPNAEQILVDLSKGAIDEVYEQSSPRLQEMARKDRFLDDMTDLAQTVGPFREITAVNDTLVTNGPTGRVGRVSLTVAYEKATCKVAVSLHYDQDRWKLLGIGVELPPELKISQHEREERIAACKDPMNQKTCAIHADSVAIFAQLDADGAGDVWDQASPIFQQQIERSRFIEVQNQHHARLGKFRRVIAVSEAKVIGGTSATFDVLVEYEKAAGVRAVVGFIRTGLADGWKLRSFKVVVPVPRAADGVRDPTVGSGSAASPHKR